MGTSKGTERYAWIVAGLGVLVLVGAVTADRAATVDWITFGAVVTAVALVDATPLWMRIRGEMTTTQATETIVVVAVVALPAADATLAVTAGVTLAHALRASLSGGLVSRTQHLVKWAFAAGASAIAMAGAGWVYATLAPSGAPSASLMVGAAAAMTYALLRDTLVVAVLAYAVGHPLLEELRAMLPGASLAAGASVLAGVMVAGLVGSHALGVSWVLIGAVTVVMVSRPLSASREANLRLEGLLQAASALYRASDASTVVEEAKRHAVRLLAAGASSISVAPPTERGVAICSSPFRVEGDVHWLVVTANGPRGRGFSRRDQRLLDGLARLTGTAMENARLHAQLNERADRDALTGLFNRRAFTQRGEEVLARSRRTAGSVGLVSIDLDGFKRVNDTYGHAAGDRLLAEVARRLTTTARLGDTVARWGGDEFLVLISDVAGPEGAAVAAARFAAALEGDHQADEQPVAASVGIAVFPDDAVELEGLIESSDRHMYASKRGADVVPQPLRAGRE
jgi:diguanylate cyclase (GGDEF)-like protein